MLTIKKNSHYEHGTYVELEWAPQYDPSNSEYSCWAPDPTQQGSITIPIHTIEELKAALTAIAIGNSLKEIKLDNE